MRRISHLILFVAATLLFSAIAHAVEGDGTLDQAASPTGAGPEGKMYSLRAMYDRFHSGTAASKGSGFTEPSAGPADGVMYTLNNVLDDFNTDATATSGTLAADVLAGNTFFATSSTTRGTDWGPVSGTMPDQTGLSVASTAQSQASAVNYFTAAQGYYDGTAKVSATDAQIAALDADIAAGNIKNGTAIFGVTGSLGGGGLPRTLQTTSYVDYDDGYYKKGVPASPSAQYTASTVGSDHIVTDNGSNLVWAAYKTEAGCNSDGTLVWSAAVAYCATTLNSATFAGYNDWRLPNIRELHSIVDSSKASAPRIDTSVFTSQSNSYWTSTTDSESGQSGRAYAVDFGTNTNVTSRNNKPDSKYLRCVRGP